jgi:UTP-glucose-1-phosphate uridylyltransferase
MRTEKFKEIKDHFRISMTLEDDVSEEAVRQYARIIESIVDEKPIYRVTAPNGKVTYHATASDISRYL